MSQMRSQGNIGYMIGISLVAALGGFLFGFDMIVVSGTIKSITALFQLDSFWLGWATSCCVFACIPGAACAGKLADVFGRKKVLLGTAVLFAVSAVGAGWASTFGAGCSGSLTCAKLSLLGFPLIFMGTGTMQPS